MPLKGETLEYKFKHNVDKLDHPKGCWVWTGCKNKAGYGLLSFAKRNGKSSLAHRYSYEKYNGSIPDGLLVRHTCDNPECVNPDHLLVGTHADNVADKIARRRHPAHKQKKCKRGHAFTPENTRISIRNGLKTRVCRTCNKLLVDLFHKKKKKEAIKAGLKYVVVATKKEPKERVVISEPFTKNKAIKMIEKFKADLKVTETFNYFQLALHPYRNQSKFNS